MMSVRFFFFSSRRRHTRLQGDWSSDVCSSDLPRVVGLPEPEERLAADLGVAMRAGDADQGRDALVPRPLEIGRASCRERVEISVVAGSLKKKKKRHRRQIGRTGHEAQDNVALD